MILRLDFSNEIPIYMQIRNQIVTGIADGGLKPGERLPAIRALADESGINMMTVSKAYQLLKQEGYIAADRRSGACDHGPRTPRWAVRQGRVGAEADRLGSKNRRNPTGRIPADLRRHLS